MSEMMSKDREQFEKGLVRKAQAVEAKRILRSSKLNTKFDIPTTIEDGRQKSEDGSLHGDASLNPAITGTGWVDGLFGHIVLAHVERALAEYAIALDAVIDDKEGDVPLLAAAHRELDDRRRAREVR